ncbi:MAG: hypothetical protein HOC71_01430, partial [Candidatus Latescibacteria bacterium]|nr:hypothetical protein [Candidatus Latescibacterota bacterium]
MYQKKVICLKVLLLFAVLAVHGGLYVSIIYAEENKPVFNEIMSSIDIKKDGYSVWNGWDFIHHDNYRNPSEIPSVPDEDGEYSDWIELFNPGDTPIDLTGYGLSDNLSSPYKWVFPAYSLAPGQYLLVFASGKDRRNSENAFLHTNFKIKATGETLVLTDSYGNIYDEVTTGYIPADISRGRQPDGGSEWVFFTEPTPGNSNTIPGNLFAGSVMFSHSGGFYESGITVALSPDSVGTVIRYTLDGRDPSENSQEYIDPLLIDKTTVIKARAFKAGLLPGHTVTHTYFIHQNSTLPVISLSTDPNGFFSSETGIYQNPDEESWERPVHVEFFEPDGSLGFSINAGTRIQGKYGTTFPQKPLSIFARGIYGCNEIEYQIFPDLPITEFDSFILRNTSSDWSYAFLRDPLIQSLFKELDVDIQSYRPAVVFINGEYWGIHHIREKQNEEYLTSHHGAGPDNVDLLKPYWRVDLPNRSILLEGDYEHYDAMFEYFETHDLSILENYEYIKTQIDLESYIDYMLAEIYCDNMSWLGNNMKCWRPKTPGGKWRWLVFDVDCGFYGHAVRGKTHVYGHNTLAFATDPDGPEPYPAWCTLIFRKLLENQTFRNDFINRFSDCLNTIFHPQRVIQQISEAKKALEPEMTAHIARWSQTEKSIQSLSDWDENVRILVDFAETRVDSVHTYIIDEFNLGGTAHVTLNVSPPGAGTIKLNSLT